MEVYGWFLVVIVSFLETLRASSGKPLVLDAWMHCIVHFDVRTSTWLRGWHGTSDRTASAAPVKAGGSFFIGLGAGGTPAEPKPARSRKEGWAEKETENLLLLLCELMRMPCGCGMRAYTARRPPV